MSKFSSCVYSWEGAIIIIEQDRKYILGVDLYGSQTVIMITLTCTSTSIQTIRRGN